MRAEVAVAFPDFERRVGKAVDDLVADRRWDRIGMLAHADRHA